MENLEGVPDFRSVRIDEASLKRRFGAEVVNRGILEKPEILPFLKPSNQIITSEDTPERNRHQSSWEFMHVNSNERWEAHFRLYDNFPLPIDRKTSDAIRSEINKELQDVHYSKKEAADYPPRLKELIGLTSGMDGWTVKPNYNFDALDAWHSFFVDLRKKVGTDQAIIRLDITYGTYFEFFLPINANFETFLDEYRSATKIMSNWLGIPYTPSLKYEFAMPENLKNDSPAKNSQSFPEYFFNVLDYWKVFEGPRKQLRALIGKSSDDKKPILILEDPSLSVSSSQTNIDILFYGGKSSNYSNLTVGGHPDIFSVFKQSIRNGAVNPNLRDYFPDIEFDNRDWLHMFVTIDESGRAALREDVESNIGKDVLRDFIPLVENQYGVSYGGNIDRKAAEKAAKEPMFMPTINKESAIIAEKYGNNTARKFRGYAISGLIHGNKHALEKYESFVKLIGE